MVAIPDFGIGAFWALNGTIIPWIAYLYVKESFFVGLLLSMGAFTGCFVQIISGVISDRTTSKWGRRTPWILFGATLAALSQLAWAFAPNYWVLLVLAFITYFFVNFFQGPYYSLVMEVVERRQIALANTLARTVAQIGGACVSFVSAVLWAQGVLTSTIAIALIIWLPVVLILPTVLRERPSQFFFETKFSVSMDFAKFPRVLQLFTATFFVYAAYAILVPMMTPYFVQYLHFTHQDVATAMTIYGVTGIVFGIFSGRLVSRLPRKFSLLVSLVLFLVSMIFGCFVHASPIALYVFVGVAGVGYLSVQINIYSLLSEISPKKRLGEFVGIMNLFISASQFVIMNAMALWLDHGGAPYLYITATGMIFIALVVMLPKIKGKKEIHVRYHTPVRRSHIMSNRVPN